MIEICFSWKEAERIVKEFENCREMPYVSIMIHGKKDVKVYGYFEKPPQFIKD